MRGSQERKGSFEKRKDYGIKLQGNYQRDQKTQESLESYFDKETYKTPEETFQQRQGVHFDYDSMSSDIRSKENSLIKERSRTLQSCNSREGIQFKPSELMSLAFKDTFMKAEQENEKIPIKRVLKALEKVKNALKVPEAGEISLRLETLSLKAKETENVEIYMNCIELEGKVLRDLGDYAKAITVFKEARIYFNTNKTLRKKLECYKLIVETFIQMRQYSNALNFTKKMLRLAWTLEDHEFEILSYDKIGLIQYYFEDLTFADFFHQKAYSNLREPKNSPIRYLRGNSMRIFKCLQEQQKNENTSDIFNIFI